MRLGEALITLCAAPGAAAPADATRRLEAAGLIHRDEAGWTPKNGLVRALVSRL